MAGPGLECESVSQVCIETLMVIQPPQVVLADQQVSGAGRAESFKDIEIIENFNVSSKLPR